MYAHSRRTLAIASLATLATFLDTTVLYVAFPDITASFSDASAAQLSWVLNAYTIVFAALLIPAGKIADRVGHRRVFLIGSALFTAASMACGLAPTVEVLIAFRVLQAAGAAALIPSSLALVMHAFAHDQLPRAVAIWGAAGAAAGALGPTLGAALIEGLRVAIGVLPQSARRHLHDRRRDAARPRIVGTRHARCRRSSGVALVATAAALLSYGLIVTEDDGWLGTKTLSFVAAGVVTLALFIAHQSRTDAPALDLDLFKARNFSWGNLTMLVFGIAFSAMFFSSILFLTQVWHWSILKAGLGVAPGPAIVAFVAPRMGKLGRADRAAADPHRRRTDLRAAGLYRLTMLGPDANYFVDYFPSMIFSGLGVACVFPQLSSLVAQAMPAGTQRRWRRRAAGRPPVRRHLRRRADDRAARPRRRQRLRSASTASGG